MEKLIYIITKIDSESGDQFKDSLIKEFAEEVNDLVHYLQIYSL